MTDNLGSRIWDARANGTALPRADVDAVGDRVQAYAVQAAATEASGLTRAGWKIAATSELAQDLLGVPGPSLGPVFAEQIVDAPANAEAQAAHGTATECEFAFVMSSDVESAEPSRDDIIAATDHALIAIEIVGCRFEGGIQKAGEMLCISDFSFHASLVKGARIDGWQDMDLSQASAAAILNGEEVARGTGAAVLGDPVEALRWAAIEAHKIGIPLRAGDIITTGTMTGATAVKAGDHVIGDFGDLGTVEVRF